MSVATYRRLFEGEFAWNDPRTLAGFTAFFNPVGDGVFDKNDWLALVSPDRRYFDESYLKVMNNWINVDPPDPGLYRVAGEYVLYWWADWEDKVDGPDVFYTTEIIVGYKPTGEVDENGRPILEPITETFYFGTYSQAVAAGFL